MNDAEREYAQMLVSMEKEVLALKTAHQRPLGALNFFKQALNFNLNIAAGSYGVAFLVTVNIATPTAKPPIVQASYNVPNGFYDVSIEQITTGGDYSSWTYDLALNNDGSAQSVAFNFEALSSQPIVDIIWSYK